MYARQFNEETLTFGVSGKLIMNALVMYDHQTDSLWSHFTGDAIEGPFAGTRLEIMPALQTTWGRWKELYPDTLVLDNAGGYQYDGYDFYYTNSAAGVIGETRTDDRLYKKEFVVGLLIGGQAKAYAFGDLSDQPVVNDSFAGQQLVVTFDPQSATGGTFSREVDGRTLTFQPLDSPEPADSGNLLMVDNETGSRWLMLTGEAVDGELAGKKLEQIPSNYSFWFAWKDWHPSTQLFVIDTSSSGPTPTPKATPTIVTFPDESLGAVIRDALNKPSGAEITKADLAEIKWLFTSGKDIADLTGIEHLVNLIELTLVWAQISDLSPLASLTNLTLLDLQSNQISDLSPLASLTKLDSLYIQFNLLDNLSPLASLTNITSLRLVGNRISDLSGLSTLTNLAELQLKANRISDLSPLASLNNLDFIDLGDNSISDITPLASLTNLTSMAISRNQISDLSPLTSLTNLDFIDLGFNNISDLSPLASLTNLTHLILDRNQISDASQLASLTNLTSLNLRNNGISDLTPLVPLINLTKLLLLYNQITDISPLLDNQGLGFDDAVELVYNLLDQSEGSENMKNINQLRARGVLVTLELYQPLGTR